MGEAVETFLGSYIRYVTDVARTREELAAELPTGPGLFCSDCSRTAEKEVGSSEVPRGS